MKIAYAATMGIPARYGGFETCVEEVATRLAQKGHDITVYCACQGSKPQTTSYKGVQLEYVQRLKRKFLDFPFRAFVSALDIMRKNVEIAHFFGTDSWPFALLPRAASLKTVLSLDGLVWKRTSYPLFVRQILRSTAGCALYAPNLTTVDSKSVQSWYHQNFGKSPLYLPYGATIDLAEPDETALNEKGLQKKKYILFVGRLVHEKGVHHLVKAFGKIETDFKLAIIGSDPYHKEYESFLRKNANGNTIFLGFVYGKDYENICKGAYLYVTPSELEGTSPALLKAMAVGNCALVSDIPENLETIGDAGFSFRNGDTEDLRKKIEFLIENPDIVQATRLKAIEHVRENYGWDKITDRLEKIYFSLVRK
jgi:glycosyltransferase involved in cell wall biosynthesis